MCSTTPIPGSSSAAPAGGDDLPDDPFWSTNLVVSAETALVLGRVDVTRTIRRLLEPYAEQVAFSGLWVAAPVAHRLAAAAAAGHDPDTEDLFRLAITVSDRLDAPALRARTRQLLELLR